MSKSTIKNTERNQPIEYVGDKMFNPWFQNRYKISNNPIGLGPHKLK